MQKDKLDIKPVDTPRKDFANCVLNCIASAIPPLASALPDGLRMEGAPSARQMNAFLSTFREGSAPSSMRLIHMPVYLLDMLPLDGTGQVLVCHVEREGSLTGPGVGTALTPTSPDGNCGRLWRFDFDQSGWEL